MTAMGLFLTESLEICFKRAESVDDYRLCADIWLEASLKAHDFIDAEFWKANRDRMVSHYLPASETTLASVVGENSPAAFSAVRGERLEALFVRPDHWGRGLGRAVLSHLSAPGRRLSLAVYADNRRAVEFYLKNGFSIQAEGPCPHSWARELEMIRLG